MVGSVNYIFLNTPPIPNSMGTAPLQLFTAQCIVDGQTFTGTGPSKQIAKYMCRTCNSIRGSQEVARSQIEATN